MTFKALLYTVSVTPKDANIGAESKEQEGSAPLEPFSPLWTIWGPLAFGSNNKHSNKIVAKMQHLRAETYNIKQVSKVFIQNFS